MLQLQADPLRDVTSISWLISVYASGLILQGVKLANWLSQVIKDSSTEDWSIYSIRVNLISYTVHLPWPLNVCLGKHSEFQIQERQREIWMVWKKSKKKVEGKVEEAKESLCVRENDTKSSQVIPP